MTDQEIFDWYWDQAPGEQCFRMADGRRHILVGGIERLTIDYETGQLKSGWTKHKYGIGTIEEYDRCSGNHLLAKLSLL